MAMFVRDRLMQAEKSLIDVGVFGAAFVMAFLARFEGEVPAHLADVLVVALPCVALVKYLGFVVLKVPSLPWRCMSLVEARRIVYAVAAGSALLLGLRLAAPLFRELLPPTRFLQIPVGVLLIDAALSSLGAVGVRACWRLWTERREYRMLNQRQARRVRTLLVGTGRQQILVAGQLAARPDLGIEPLGFLDDDPGKVGMMMRGLPVLGTVSQMRDVIRDTGARQVLITSSDLSKAQLRRLIDLAEGCGVATKIVADGPGADGRIDLARVRDVAIDDLLGREPVRLDLEAIAGVVRGRRVMVTGAGGSIGSELCREICRFGPACLMLVEQAENSLFWIHRELSQRYPKADLIPCVADICDLARVEQLMAGHRPAVVFHAAAHKHVPLMEENPGEAVKNNVLGTRGLADLAHAHGVDEFVMISTDKAVNPSSVMGVSKRVAELYVQALSQRSRTRFVTVRFGNVLGSAGSVIPIFKEQIGTGGPVLVTHPEMKRYFMTIPEACQLILEAASLGRGGEIFILDMGEPVKIIDLARDLIRLAGLTPDKDIEIRFTGVRPGEKLSEELTLEEENAERTCHPRIFTGRIKPQDWQKINRLVDELGRLAGCADVQHIHAKFKEIVPEYRYQTPLCQDAPRPDWEEVHRNGTIPAVAGNQA